MQDDLFAKYFDSNCKLCPDQMDMLINDELFSIPVTPSTEFWLSLGCLNIDFRDADKKYIACI